MNKGCGAYAPAGLVRNKRRRAYAPAGLVQNKRRRAYAPAGLVKNKQRGAYAPAGLVKNNRRGAYALRLQDYGAGVRGGAGVTVSAVAAVPMCTWLKSKYPYTRSR